MQRKRVCVLLDIAQRGRGQLFQVAQLRCGKRARVMGSGCGSGCMVTVISTRISGGISRGTRGRGAQRRAKRRTHGKQGKGHRDCDSQAAAQMRLLLHTILRYAGATAGSILSIRDVGHFLLPLFRRTSDIQM